jgi:hypothetical protein
VEKEDEENRIKNGKRRRRIRRDMRRENGRIREGEVKE